MKKIGTLNSQISKIISEMGHGHKLVIGDAGLPIPKDATKADLALTKDIPGFIETLKVILTELEVESAIIAEEMESVSPDVLKEIKDLLPNISFKKVSHEEFKSIYRSDREVAFVRTGETTPYANIILISGVTF